MANRVHPDRSHVQKGDNAAVMEAKKKELEMKRAAAASKGAKVFYKVTVKVGPDALTLASQSTAGVTLKQHINTFEEAQMSGHGHRPASELSFGSVSILVCPAVIA